MLLFGCLDMNHIVFMTQFLLLSWSLLSMLSYGSAFWILVSIFQSGFVCLRCRCTKTLYRAWLKCLPHNNLSCLTNCANSLNLTNPSCNQPLPLASSASCTCWHLERNWVYYITSYALTWWAYIEAIATLHRRSVVRAPIFGAQCCKFYAFVHMFH